MSGDLEERQKSFRPLDELDTTYTSDKEFKVDEIKDIQILDTLASHNTRATYALRTEISRRKASKEDFSDLTERAKQRSAWIGKLSRRKQTLQAEEARKQLEELQDKVTPSLVKAEEMRAQIMQLLVEQDRILSGLLSEANKDSQQRRLASRLKMWKDTHNRALRELDGSLGKLNLQQLAD